MKKLNLFTTYYSRLTKAAFTLAETLIVIGIIGVVAALTLPNLNHATGDKETVTRLQKAYSVLAEATDRAVAIYGPISSWGSSEQCANDIDYCLMKRIGEFLKISKSCDNTDDDNNSYESCKSLAKGMLEYHYNYHNIIYQLADGMVITLSGTYPNGSGCDATDYDVMDVCVDEIWIDINGPSKGKNDNSGNDQFRFMISDSLGFMPYTPSHYEECISGTGDSCAAWVLDFGNLDYLKTDSEGKCNDNPSIVLDGVTNTSCH